MQPRGALRDHGKGGEERVRDWMRGRISVLRRSLHSRAMNNQPQPIPEETRRLFLAAMAAEAAGFTGLAQALRVLLGKGRK